MADSPAASWLAANLEALAAALGAEVALTGGGPWLATATPQGISLQLRTPGGTLVAAQSRRQPAAEAARLVDEALSGRACPPFALVIGAGLGTVVDDLLGRDATIRVLVIEPDPSGAAALLGHRDWSSAIVNGRLLVLVGPHFPGVERAWRFVPSSDAAPLVIVHPVLAREYPDEARRAAAVGTRVLGDARANAGAETTLAGPYLLNTIANLGVVAHEGDVDALAGAFADVPAIVVAAGPSLDRVIPDLVRLQDRALVIAVDTALRPLLSQGIAPHLAVAVDPSERNARHLSNLDGAGATWLVAEPGVHPSAFPAFAGRTFTFRVGDNHPWPWLASLGVRRGTLAAWGSVLVSALDLAIRVGARPIAIVGADLAYTGGQPYCRGTAFEEDWAREVRKGERLADVWHRVAARPGAQEQPDVHGRPTPTLPHLVAFRDRLLEQIAASGRRIVNATGGGILHGRGLELASLDAVLGGAAGAGEPGTRLRSRHQASRMARAAVATLDAALTRGDASRQLAAEVPGVDGYRLASIVGAARETIAVPPTPAPARVNRPETDAPLWWPEQTAMLASLDDASNTALAPVASSEAGAPRLADVLAAARDLLEPDRSIAGPADAATILREALALPLPLLLPFAPETRADAARFAAALARWVHAHHSTPAVAEPVFWSLPPQSLDDTRRIEDSAAASHGLARLAIGAAMGAAMARAARGTPMLSRVATTALRSWPRVVSEARRTARVSLDVAGPGADRVKWLDDVALAPLSRALTGTLVPSSRRSNVHRGVADPSLVVSLILDSGDEWSTAGEGDAATARLLTPVPCAPCLFGAALDDDRAIVSRQDLGGSYIIDGKGDVCTADDWPVPVLAVAPWGADGGSYAWTSRPGRLLVRDAKGVVIHDVALPFTPSGADADGEALRFTALDGLWRWTPDGGAVRVVETPALVFATSRDDGRLELAPLPQPAAPAERRRTSHVLCWSAASGLLEAPALPLGPCWSRTTRGDWTADALPEANLVRVTASGRVRGWIIADRPRTVAWAGGSLVVVLAGGHVAFVPDARAALG